MSKQLEEVARVACMMLARYDYDPYDARYRHEPERRTLTVYPDLIDALTKALLEAGYDVKKDSEKYYHLYFEEFIYPKQEAELAEHLAKFPVGAHVVYTSMGGGRVPRYTHGKVIPKPSHLKGREGHVRVAWTNGQECSVHWTSIENVGDSITE